MTVAFSHLRLVLFNPIGNRGPSAANGHGTLLALVNRMQTRGHVTGDHVRINRRLYKKIRERMERWYQGHADWFPDSKIQYIVTLHKYSGSHDFHCDIEMVDGDQAWFGAERDRDPYTAFRRALLMLQPIRSALIA